MRSEDGAGSGERERGRGTGRGSELFAACPARVGTQGQQQLGPPEVGVTPPCRAAPARVLGYPVLGWILPAVPVPQSTGDTKIRVVQMSSEIKTRLKHQLIRDEALLLLQPLNRTSMRVLHLSRCISELPSGGETEVSPMQRAD